MTTAMAYAAPVVNWLGSAWAGLDRQVAFISMVATVLSLAATVVIAVVVARSSAANTARAHQLATDTAEWTRQGHLEVLRQQLRVTDNLPHANMLLARGRDLTSNHPAERVDLEAVWAANVVVPLPHSAEDLPVGLGREDQARVLNAALQSLAGRQLLFRESTRTTVELTVLAKEFGLSTAPIVEMLGRHLAHESISSHEMVTDLFGAQFSGAKETMLGQLPEYLGLAGLGGELPLHSVVNLAAGVSEVIAAEKERLPWLIPVCREAAIAYRWLLLMNSRKIADSDWEFGMTRGPAETLAETIYAAGIVANGAGYNARSLLIGPVQTILRALTDSSHGAEDLDVSALTQGVELIIGTPRSGPATDRLRGALKQFIEKV